MPTKALVVDDKEEGRAFLAAVLRGEGMDVACASSGADALERLDAERDYDLVISDILMPRMDGLQLCFEIKKRKRLRQIPVVFYTAAYTSPADERLALGLGAARLVVKPAEPERLAAIVREVLRERRPADPPKAFPDEAFLRQYDERLVQKREQKLVELDAAKQRLEHLVSIVEDSDDAIVSVDLDGSIVSWNRGAERLFGYSLTEAIGRSAAMLVPSQRRDEDERTLARIAREERVEHYETERARKSGEVFAASVTVSPVRGHGGKVTGASMILRDVTERKRTAEERERLLAETQQALRARDDFLSVASHELRTPVTSLLLTVQQLRETLGESARAAEMLARCERQTRRLARLIDELIDVTRIRAGILSLDLVPVDLADVVREVLEREIESGAGVAPEIRASLAAPVVGRWDRARLDRVVTNLVGNARKFGDGKPLTVRLGASDGTARLEVADQGIGIPADRLEAIFDPFERAVSARSFGGLGLGLFIVKKSVEALGGTVRVQSAPGRGSAFTVDLPLSGPPGAREDSP